ncbi:hypothetical protein R1flu_014355 [Riccia fluitans]|uniref:Uncharacterized protein n=1 Tax=Riccia fluitans TaxID=41844 RepID=A0ABD1YGY4_9MARC
MGRGRRQGGTGATLSVGSTLVGVMGQRVARALCLLGAGTVLLGRHGAGPGQAAERYRHHLLHAQVPHCLGTTGLGRAGGRAAHAPCLWGTARRGGRGAALSGHDGAGQVGRREGRGTGAMLLGHNGMK